MMTPPTVLSVADLGKRFAGRPALEGVSLDVRPGEVHGLLGQNGSGKSTLIKILAGYHQPDGGSLNVRGEPVALPLRPGQAGELGMSFVHQDLGLIPAMTVLENLRATRFRTGFAGRIDWRHERRATYATLARFEISAGADTKVGALREIDRALLAIARAVEDTEGDARGRLLVLDEPTVYLPRDGTAKLFEAVRKVAAQGAGVLFVSHRLEEVLEICDRVTVLRDARNVGTVNRSDLTERALVQLILGRSLEELYPEPHHSGRAVRLKVRSLAGGVVRDVSFDLHEGEVLGLTGLAGMGFEQTPYLLFGAVKGDGGTVEVNGRTIAAGELTPRVAKRSGIALLPANRQRDGGLGAVSVLENVSLPVLTRYFQGGRLHRGLELRDVEGLLEEFQVTPADPRASFASLSGGNQQKALVAKWLQTEPSVLMMHEPTQGVDVGSRKQIFKIIRDAAESGCSVILASAEYEDLAHLCDRVVIFRNGRPASSIDRSRLSKERIIEQCYLGGSTGSSAAVTATM